ncbi:IS4 family transposase [Oceanisphaera marina]|uniref:IS4 family transposase n=1 Tax=Oceanisphaera marina TaxID=2017550 RepID=A0ABQ1J070_9GAMM|nr:IS4 family transposase [Oceanisphaera marina]GGB55391.1 IS4 family transposase [Oceanisphaera marina]
MTNWVEQEFATADLGDERLNQRLAKVVETLARQPGKSITAACRGWSETKATYRLLEQDIGWDCLLQPHWDSTLARAAEHNTVLCLQDTTELDFNGRKAEGLGKLNYDARRGMYLHPTLMVTPERLPLGITDAWMWARDGQQPKESERWLEGYQRISELKQQLPDTRLVYVGDREADLFTLYQEHTAFPNIDYLIRGKHNRKLADGRKLKEAVAAAPVLGEVSFTLPKGRKRPSRPVTLHIRATQVVLKQQQLPITVVLAEEQNAPAGATPISWMLLSNIQVETLSGAQELLNWYLCRWDIELFFKTLKSGCRVESMQLRSREKLERLLVLKMIVAWRVMYLMRLNRVVPELSCELVFDPEEWRIIYASTLRKTPPKDAPSLRTMLHLVASYGGYLGRKGDREPGLQTLWLGLERCHDMVRAIQETKELLG